MRDKELRQKLFGQFGYYFLDGGLMGKTISRIKGLTKDLDVLKRKYGEHLLVGNTETDEIVVNLLDRQDDIEENVETLFSMIEQIYCEMNEGVWRKKK